MQNNISISDAIGIVCILYAYPHHKDVDAWQIVSKPQNYLVLSKRNQLRQYLTNSDFTLEQLALLLSNETIIPQSDFIEILIAIFLKKYSNTHFDLLVSVLKKHAEIISNSPAIIESLSQKISFPELAKQLDFLEESLRYAFFKNKPYDSVEWIDAYVSFDNQYRRQSAYMLIDWHENHEKIFLAQHSEKHEIVYRDLIEVLISKDLFFSSSLFSNWDPRREVMIDKIILQNISSDNRFFDKFVNHVVEKDDLSKFNWVLDEYPLDVNKIIELLSLIIRLSDDTNVPDNKLDMFQSCKKRLVQKDIDFNKYFGLEQSLLVKRFHTSAKIQDIFFIYLNNLNESDIEHFLRSLLMSDFLKQGINLNKELGTFLTGSIEDIILLKNKKKIKNNILLPVVSARRQDINFVSKCVEYLVDGLPEEKGNNSLLVEIVKRNLCQDISFEIAIKWLNITRNTDLRNEYLVNGRDLLRATLTSWFLGEDSSLWEIYVIDVVYTRPINFSWFLFVQDLPPYNSYSSLYKKFKSIIDSIDDPQFSNRELYLMRLDVCIQLTYYQVGEKAKSDLKKINDYYHDNRIIDEKLKNFIKHELNLSSTIAEKNMLVKNESDTQKNRPVSGRTLTHFRPLNKHQIPEDAQSKQQERRTVTIFLLLADLMLLGIIILSIFRLLKSFSDFVSFAILMASAVFFFIISLILFLVRWER